jgi:hypothetical protein
MQDIISILIVVTGALIAALALLLIATRLACAIRRITVGQKCLTLLLLFGRAALPGAIAAPNFVKARTTGGHTPQCVANLGKSGAQRKLGLWS